MSDQQPIERGYVHHRKETFGKVPEALMHNTKIPDGAVRMYSHMQWRFGANRQNFEGRGSIAQMLDISEATVTARAAALEAEDWIIVVHRNTRQGRVTNFYHVFEDQQDCRDWRQHNHIPKPALAGVEQRKSRKGIGGRPSHKPKETQVNLGQLASQSELKLTQLVNSSSLGLGVDLSQPEPVNEGKKAAYPDSSIQTHNTLSSASPPLAVPGRTPGAKVIPFKPPSDTLEFRCSACGTIALAKTPESLAEQGWMIPASIAPLPAQPILAMCGSCRPEKDRWTYINRASRHAFKRTKWYPFVPEANAILEPSYESATKCREATGYSAILGDKILNSPLKQYEDWNVYALPAPEKPRTMRRNFVPFNPLQRVIGIKLLKQTEATLDANRARINFLQRAILTCEGYKSDEKPDEGQAQQLADGFEQVFIPWYNAAYLARFKQPGELPAGEYSLPKWYGEWVSLGKPAKYSAKPQAVALPKARADCLKCKGEGLRTFVQEPGKELREYVPGEALGPKAQKIAQPCDCRGATNDRSISASGKDRASQPGS